jgi:glutaredoxin-like YruB-family protein
MEKKVIVYSTETCPYCVMVKEFLKQEGVEFKDINVGKDHDKAEEMVEKSGQIGVPVTDIDGEIIIGFNKDKIKEVLEKKGFLKKE